MKGCNLCESMGGECPMCMVRNKIKQSYQRVIDAGKDMMEAYKNISDPNLAYASAFNAAGSGSYGESDSYTSGYTPSGGSNYSSGNGYEGGNE
jgi:hypothetical protein